MSEFMKAANILHKSFTIQGLSSLKRNINCANVFFPFDSFGCDTLSHVFEFFMRLSTQILSHSKRNEILEKLHCTRGST